MNTENTQQQAQSESVKIPKQYLSTALADLISLNQAVKRVASYSPSDLNFVRDFGTIVIHSGMRTGKTYLAEKMAQDPKTLLITVTSESDLITALAGLRNTVGISTVVVDCWLPQLLGFHSNEVDSLILKASGQSVICAIAYSVQQALGHDAQLIILG